MRRHFVETRLYTRRADLMGEAMRLAIEKAIMENPAAGAVIPGTRGMRKLRLSDPSRGKGRRGGFRVIYLDLPERGETLLLAMYAKGEQEDLRAAEKRALTGMVAEYLGEVV